MSTLPQGWRPPDEPAREAARGALARSLLVEAGAGTGKTSLIVDRLVALIESGVALRSIVAITFTEKAAGELKIRVRQALEKRASTSPRARAALLEIERASISTIHAWSASLLRAYPVESGVDPLFTVLDQTASDALFNRVWEEWLGRELSGKGSGALPIAQLPGFTVEWWVRQLEALARFVVRERARLPDALPESKAGDHSSALAAAYDRIDFGSFAHGVDPTDKMVQALQKSAFAQKEFIKRQPAEREAMLFGQLELPSSTTRLGNKQNWKGAARGEAGLEQAREALEGIVSVWKEARASAAHDLCTRVARWIAEGFVPAYEAEKARAGALDFDDLLTRVATMLRTDAGVRREVRRSVRHLILDEFQDTDPVQCEAAFLLTSEHDTADWRTAKPRPGALFLVGDPKQSIYAFRGADIETYVAARERLEATSDVLTIGTNFRSRGPVLDWVNAVFSKLIQPPEGGGRWQIGYAPLDAAHPAGADGSGVHVLHPAPGTEFVKVSESRDAETRAVAALLRDRAHGKWIVREKRTGTERPARWGDVVVLLRNRTSSLPAYEHAFRAAGIPYVVVGGRALWQRQEVRALSALCAAIENPFDSVSVVAALKSPFFGASDAELLLWKHVRGAFVARADDATEPRERQEWGAVGTALAMIREWHRERLDVPPYRLLHRILTGTGAMAAFGLKPDGAQRVANLLRLVESARDAGDAFGPAGSPPSFRAFAGELAARVRDVREEAEGTILEDEADAVRIMTMHASKGLEFPIVVLGDLAVNAQKYEGATIDPESKRLAFRLGKEELGLETRGFSDVRESLEVRARAEDLRLLYVAATRAADALVLPMYVSKRAPGFFYKKLAEEFPGLVTGELGAPVKEGEGGPAVCVGGDLAPVVGDPPVFRIPAEELVAALSELPGAGPGAGGSERPGTGAGAGSGSRAGAGSVTGTGTGTGTGRFAARAIGRRVDSVTRLLAVEAPVVTEAALHGGIRYALAADEARGVGTAVHHALEVSDLWDADGLARNAKAAASARALSPKAIALAETLARNAALLGCLPRVHRAPRVLREFPFVLRGEDGSLLEGIVDLAWVEDGGLVLLDYKTDTLGTGHDAAVRAADHHWPQLHVYAHALQAITGLPVRRAILAFLAGPAEVERELKPSEVAEAGARIARAFDTPLRVQRA